MQYALGLPRLYGPACPVHEPCMWGAAYSWLLGDEHCGVLGNSDGQGVAMGGAAACNAASHDVSKRSWCSVLMLSLLAALLRSVPAACRKTMSPPARKRLTQIKGTWPSSRIASPLPKSALHAYITMMWPTNAKQSPSRGTPDSKPTRSRHLAAACCQGLFGNVHHACSSRCWCTEVLNACLGDF